MDDVNVLLVSKADDHYDRLRALQLPVTASLKTSTTRNIVWASYQRPVPREI